jgi:hypothetical protein
MRRHERLICGTEVNFDCLCSMAGVPPYPYNALCYLAALLFFFSQNCLLCLPIFPELHLVSSFQTWLFHIQLSQFHALPSNL